MSGRAFLHADLDAFFASVEQRDNPDLRGKPVIVGGLPSDRRAVVATASYEARKFGVHSAMSASEARRLCPHGIFLRARHERYEEVSAQIMDIFREYSPDVAQMSIDEAFIDLTGTELLFGDPACAAMRLKKEVKEKTGLSVSVGLAANKYVAKIASDMKKPDGFFEVKEGDEEKFMLSLPLKKIWGLGEKTLRRLNGAGIWSARDLHEKSEALLRMMFGEAAGAFLYSAVRGNEAEKFESGAAARSISAEKTFDYDISDVYTAETALMGLCHTVMFRLRREGFRSRVALVKLRYDDFTTVSARETGAGAITSLEDLYGRVRALFEKKYERGRGVRLLGVGAENIEADGEEAQRELFENQIEKKRRKVEQAILNLEEKHPDVKVRKARVMARGERPRFS